MTVKSNEKYTCKLCKNCKFHGVLIDENVRSSSGNKTKVIRALICKCPTSTYFNQIIKHFGACEKFDVYDIYK